MKHGLLTICAALMFAIAACGGGGDGGNDTSFEDDGGENLPPDDNENPPPDDNENPPPDSLAVCDPCTVDTLSAGFGDCLNACRVDCPEQFSECRDACLDECDGCGTGLSCLFSSDTRAYRCGPKSEITTCDGVEYGGGT
jgi:hypothetical protein